MIRHHIDSVRPEDLSPFESLLHPLTAEDFLGRIWQQEVLHIVGPPGRQQPVIDEEQFLRTLFEAGLGAKEIAFYPPSQTGSERNRDTFFRLKAAWQEVPTLDRLAREIDGGTLVFDQIEQRVESARKWCLEIFEATGCRAFINAYFSAGQGASPFGAHRDTQDVFVVQVTGEKDWLVWENGPQPADPKERAPERPEDRSVRLSCGDMLYVPKGTWHWPKTTGESPSLHLSVSLVAPTALDIVNWLHAVLEGEPFAHRGLPSSPLQAGKAEESEALARAIALLQAELASPDASKRAAMHAAVNNMSIMHRKKSR